MHKFLLLTCHVYYGTHGRELLTLSGSFQDCLEIFRLSRNSSLCWKLQRLCGNFLHCLEIFLTGWKLSRLAENSQDCVETFHRVWKLFRLSGHFPDSPETFQTVRTLSRLSGKFPDCPKTFQTLRKQTILYQNFPDSLVNSKTYSPLSWCFGFIFVNMRKKYPVGNADTPTGFLGLWLDRSHGPPPSLLWAGWWVWAKLLHRLDSIAVSVSEYDLLEFYKYKQ